MVGYQGVKRYETDIRDDILYLESDDGWFEIGTMDDICELVGGETYTLKYDDRQRSVGWLDTDEAGELTFDVHEVLGDMSYEREFVTNVASTGLDDTDVDGYPLRTSVFADLMIRIWDSKGDFDSVE